MTQNSVLLEVELVVSVELEDSVELELSVELLNGSVLQNQLGY